MRPWRLCRGAPFDRCGGACVGRLASGDQRVPSASRAPDRWRGRSLPLVADERRAVQPPAPERSAGYAASEREPSTIDSATSAASATSASTSAFGSRKRPST
jgi:hypothetical protein